MAIRVRIKGFGRIGRQVYRAMPTYYADEVEVVAVKGDLDAQEQLASVRRSAGGPAGTRAHFDLS